MKISIINGSSRENSQSLKVANYIQNVLNNGIADQSWLFSLRGNPLPLWDEGVWDGAPHWQQRLDPIKSELTGSDAFVVITPEWHGQVPAALKNFFLLFGKNELGHKPALIVSVSSGDGGAYPVAELRMSSYKNSRICYIPEQVIVRHVEKVLNDDPQTNDARSDPYIRERLQWALNILKQYAIALKQVRDSGVTASDKFKNGM